MTLDHPAGFLKSGSTTSTLSTQNATKTQIASAGSQHAVGISSSSGGQYSNDDASLSTSQAQFRQEGVDPMGVSQNQLPSKSVTSLASKQAHSSSAISAATLTAHNKSVTSLSMRHVKNGSLRSVSSFFKNNRKGLLLSGLDREKLPQMTTSSRKIFERFGTDPRTETAIPEAHQQHVSSDGRQISSDDTIDEYPDEYHHYLKDGDEQVVRSKPFTGVVDKESGDLISLTIQPLMSGGLDGGHPLVEGEATGLDEVVVQDEPVVVERTITDDAQDDAQNEAFANDDEDSISESYLTNQKPPSLLYDHQDLIIIKLLSSSDGSSINYIIHTAFAYHHSPILAHLIRRYPAGPVLVVAELEGMFAFGAVQAWIYTQSTNGWRDVWGEVFNWRIYMVWKLAQTLRMPALQNASMRLIATTPAPLALANWIYDNTKPDDKLRLCFVQILALANENFPASHFGDQKIPASLFLDYTNVVKSLEHLSKDERDRELDAKSFYVEVN